MKISLVPVDLKLPAPLTPRSEGIHVSSLIRCIALETGILEAKWAEDLSLVDAREITDQVSIIRISIGLAWEQWYIPQLPDVVDHPGEMQVDGIYMTHDGESVDTLISRRGPDLYILALHEVKATYKSLNTVWHPDLGDEHSLDSQFMWLSQCMAYCKGLGTNIAYLHVLFLCGDYSYPITPMLVCWRIEFTQEEIDTRWELLVDYMHERLSTDGGMIP